MEVLFISKTMKNNLRHFRGKKPAVIVTAKIDFLFPVDEERFTTGKDFHEFCIHEAWKHLKSKSLTSDDIDWSSVTINNEGTPTFDGR